MKLEQSAYGRKTDGMIDQVFPFSYVIQHKKKEVPGKNEHKQTRFAGIITIL